MRYPHSYILLTDCRRHQVGELVGRTSKGRHTDICQKFCMIFVIRRGTVIIQGGQYDKLHATIHQ